MHLFGAPIFADGIDIPIVLGAGFIILAPLLLFEVVVEAFVLQKVWRLPFRLLCGFTLGANLWSLFSGIPVKIACSFIGTKLLPHDIPGYYARYPAVATLTAAIYFLVTVAVEGACAFGLRTRVGSSLPGMKLWRGILIANAVTYGVVAPTYYFCTRPIKHFREITDNTHWAAPSGQTILYTDPVNGSTRVKHLDGSMERTLIPFPVLEFLVSSNLDVALLKSTNGSLVWYCPAEKSEKVIWRPEEGLTLDQAAFSPSGRRVAFANHHTRETEVVDTQTGTRVQLGWKSSSFGNFSVAWSRDEDRLVIWQRTGRNRMLVTVKEDGSLSQEELVATNMLEVFPCYGKFRHTNSDGRGDDWDAVLKDTCEELSAEIVPGLESSLCVTARTSAPVLWFRVGSGLLRLPDFSFDSVAFVGDCRGIVIESSGYLYLLDIPSRRLGTLTRGRNFVLLNKRFEKRID